MTAPETLFAKARYLEGNEIDIGQGCTAKGANELIFREHDKGNRVVIGRGSELHNLKVVFKARQSTLSIGDDVRLTGHILIVGMNRKVSIGARTTAQGEYILARDADVTIGSDCMFSREIEVRATDVHKLYSLDTGERLNVAKPVVIGDRVWVAARAFVSKGAVVPNGSVVGAASFVNRPFSEENVVLAGSPARVVKQRVRWER